MDADSVVEAWSSRAGEFSPRYYAYYGPNQASDRLLRLLETSFTTDAAILELGCSSGRHLAHLFEHGYRDLTGIEVNPDAFDVMDEAYPDLAAAGTFYRDRIETVLPDLPDNRFDVVFSVETLQHIHPDNDWVFDEIARITDDMLVTVEIEHDIEGTDRAMKYVDADIPLYYRDWKTVFSAVAFTQREMADFHRATLRVFSRRR